MPQEITYPSGFGLPGITRIDEGLIIECMQGYAVIPTTPVASVPLLDVNTGLQLTISAPATSEKFLTGMRGGIYNAPVVLASSGTLKVANTFSIDTSVGTTNPAASPKNAAGVVQTGTTLAPGLNFAGTPHTNNMSNSLAFSTATTYSVFGASVTGTSATAINISSASATRPAIILVQFFLMQRDHALPSIADFQKLPDSVKGFFNVVV